MISQKLQTKINNADRIVNLKFSAKGLNVVDYIHDNPKRPIDLAVYVSNNIKECLKIGKIPIYLNTFCGSFKSFDLNHKRTLRETLTILELYKFYKIPQKYCIFVEFNKKNYLALKRHTKATVLYYDANKTTTLLKIEQIIKEFELKANKKSDLIIFENHYGSIKEINLSLIYQLALKPKYHYFLSSARLKGYSYIANIANKIKATYELMSINAYGGNYKNNKGKYCGCGSIALLQFKKVYV